MKPWQREFPGASPFQDRHGKRRWRYQRDGFAAHLGTEYGSADFVERYEAALRGERLPSGSAVRKAPSHGSVAALVASFKTTPQYLGWKASTRLVYGARMEKLAEEHGHRAAALIDREVVLRLMAAKSATPTAANHLRKSLSMLMDHAIALGWRLDNPVQHVKPYKVTGGYHTWTEAEIAKFFRAHGPESIAARAMTLMLYTGAARSDACALGWQNVRGGRLVYRRMKTGKEIDIPMHPQLRAMLAALPRDRLTFLETRPGKSRSPDGLGGMMRTACDRAGLPECSSHGLRKAMCRRLAEAGASAHEIMAVSGHSTLAEVQRYTVEAQRRGLADTAISRLDLANPHSRLANGRAKDE